MVQDQGVSLVAEGLRVVEGAEWGRVSEGAALSLGVKASVVAAWRVAVVWGRLVAGVDVTRGLSEDNDGLGLEVQRIMASLAPGEAEREAEHDSKGWSLDSVQSVFGGDLPAEVSLQSAIMGMQKRSKVGRFNPERCWGMFQGDPEFDCLLEIASRGVVIDVAQDFCPNVRPDPPRPLCQRLRATIARHVLRLQSEGAVMLVRPSVLAQYGPHYSNLHWTPKPGKPEGRLLCDCSNREVGNALNSEEAKAMGTDRYGDLKHPTIVQIVQMICDVADRLGGLEYVFLWKEDVAKAFEQCDFVPSCCHLLSVRVGEDLDMVYLQGMFGWAVMPFVFGVFSRALKRLCDSQLNGRVEIYVDDIMGAGSRGEVLLDQSRTQSILTGVFGPGGWNESKSLQPSSQAEFIGWLVDTAKGTIRPNDKGIRKLVSSFFEVDIARGQGITLVLAQRLASLAVRYSQCILGMRPFVRPLVALTVGGHAVRRLSSMAKLAVVLWRAVALVLLKSPGALAVPLRSLVRGSGSADVFVVTDAGPAGLGLIMYDAVGSCLGFLSYRLPYSAIESKYQNVREFHGLLLAEVMLASLGFRHTCYHWVGDNMAALSWARKESCSSGAAHSAFLAHSWLALRSGNVLVEVEHCPGVDMGDVDRLSRFREPLLLEGMVNWDGVVDLNPLFQVCDPLSVEDRVHCHAARLVVVSDCIEAVLGAGMLPR